LDAVAAEEVVAEAVVVEVVAAEEIVAEAIAVEAVAAEEIVAEAVVVEAVAAEEIVAEEVVLEAVAAEEIVAEAVVVEAVAAEEIVAEEVVLEAVAAEEVVEPIVAEVGSEPAVPESSTIVEDVLIPAAEKVAVHLVKEAVVSTAESVTDAVKEATTEDITPQAPVEAVIEPVAEDVVEEVVTEVEPGDDDKVEVKIASLEPGVLTPEQLAAVASSCALYAPLGSKLSLPFKDYCTIKNGTRNRRRIFGTLGFLGAGPATWMAVQEQCPEYFGLEPVEIMGLDSMLVVGAGSLGAACVGSYLCTVLAKQMSIGWFGGKYRAMYKERDSDFKRRVLHHLYIGTETKVTDRHDKLTNGSDYRQWVRAEQDRRAKYADA